MRILFVSSMEGVPWGGSEALWVGAASHIAATGKHRVSALVKRWPVIPRSIQALQQSGCRVYRYPGSPLRAAMHRLWGSWGEERFLHWTQPDLAVISQGMNDDGYAWMEACRRRQVPYLAIVQAANPGHCIKEWIRQSLRQSYPAAQEVLFVSAINQRTTEDQIGTGLTNARVIWNPFNVDYDVRCVWPSEAAIAVVGRLLPEAKGCDLVCRAVRGATWGTTPPAVRFYGEGPAQPRLEDLCQRIGASHIEFKGFETDVRSIWDKHQLLLLPSRFEGLPLAVVEAMLCARPCLVNAETGGDELITDGVTGFISPGATIQALQKTLERAWKSRGLWQTMGKKAAQSVREKLPRNPCAVLAERILTYDKHPK